MWRRAVQERVEEEPEPGLRLLVTDLQEAENPLLQGLVVDPDAAPSNFAAVQHEVVRSGPYGLGFVFQTVEVRQAG